MALAVRSVGRVFLVLPMKEKISIFGISFLTGFALFLLSPAGLPSQEFSRIDRKIEPDYEIFFESKSKQPNRKLKKEIEELISNFTKVDYELRRFSREDLVSLGRPVVPFLFEELSGGNRARALNAALILSSLRYQKITPFLEDFIRKTDRDELKAYGILALGKVGGSESALAIAKSTVGGKNQQVLICTALALGRLQEPQTQSYLLSLYRRASNAKIRAAVLLALGRMGDYGDQQVKAILLNAVRGNNSLERRAALLALGDLKTEWCLKRIKKSLIAKKRKQRISAIASICRFAPGEGEDLVRKIAVDSRDAVEMRTAVLALGNYREKETLELIKKAAGNKEPAVRVSAAFALTPFGKSEASFLLQRLARDRASDVRLAAVLALAFLEDKAADSLFKSKAGDLEEDFSIRFASLLGYCFLNGKEAVEDVRRFSPGKEDGLEKDLKNLEAILRMEHWKADLRDILLKTIRRIGGLPGDLFIKEMNELLIPILGLDKEMEFGKDKEKPPSATLTKQEQDLKVWLSDHPYFPH